MTVPFQEHDIHWTRELSSRFWNFKAHVEASYCSDEVGPAILRAVTASGVPLRGNVLDFGCGPGYLLAHLTQRKIACQGADFSADSVRETEKRLAGDPYFRGALQIHSIPTNLPSDHFDIIFCIETIEHILDADLLPTYRELFRISRPGGYLVLTTPNDEDIDRFKVICPECGCIFHHMQHVRSWNVESLARFAHSAGFSQVACYATHFHKLVWVTRLRSVLARLLGRKLPNLIFIGQKDMDPVSSSPVALGGHNEVSRQSPAFDAAQ